MRFKQVLVTVSLLIVSIFAVASQVSSSFSTIDGNQITTTTQIILPVSNTDVLSTIAAIATVIAAITAIVQLFYERRRKRSRETIQDRISRLTRSLSEAVGLINQIENEVKSRQELVTELREEARTYQNIASLKKNEVEAVAQILHGELQRQERRSIFIDVVINVGLFLLGIAVSIMLRLIHIL